MSRKIATSDHDKSRNRGRIVPDVARTPAQRGEIGNWLVESRMARGWTTQKKARAEIERLARWRIPQSVYAEWESGRRVPSDANMEKLRDFYGVPAGQGSAGSTDAAIVAAIDRLTAAIERQTAERSEWERGFLSALGELLPGAARSADPVGGPLEGARR